MNRSTAEIVREYGPFPGVERVGGVTYDGQQVWMAAGDKLASFDAVSGQATRTIDVPAHAGTAFDGTHLYQIWEGCIHKIDPDSGLVVGSIPAPAGEGSSGLAWAEGSLWVGSYQDRRIYEVDPGSGDVLKTIQSNRFVTGVTWLDGELWHAGTDGDQSELRRIDSDSGDVLETVEMPADVFVSGLESDGRDTFFCGGASSGKVRAVRRPTFGAEAAAT